MKRNPYACIYTSSYDRGLEHLLKMWPEVKNAVPEAELHIYYGWQLFEKFFKGNPERMDWKNRMDEMMKHDGITHHGRVPQHEIVKRMSECGVWAYPTHFGEISCISAMKAQAYGSIPCVVNYAALDETVQYGIKIDGDIYEDETREEYTTALIGLLKDHDMQDSIRKTMMSWAKKKYTWASVAEQWSKEFKK